MKYRDIVKAVFSCKGSLQEVTGRSSKEQAQYADAIATVIDSQGKLGLLEAATGTGKTLGYLLPALLYIAQQKKAKKIVIVTYTRALQRQIINSDIQIAKKFFQHIDLPLPKVALRMGRTAFFSPKRVSERVEWLIANESEDEKQHAEWRKFSSFAQQCSEIGSGMWLDWMDSHPRLPEGIKADEINLIYGIENDNPAYIRHLEKAQDADLLITNYATLLANQNIVDNKNIHALICDEAHEIINACEHYTNKKYQLQKINNNISRAQNIAPGKLIEQTSKELEQWQTKLLLSDKEKKADFWTDYGDSTLLEAQRPHAENLVKRLKLISKYFDIEMLENNFDIETAQNITDSIDIITTFLKGSQGIRQRAIGFSDIKRLPSLATISAKPGLLFGRIAKNLSKRIVLTSATIADAKYETRFSQICIDLGFRDEIGRIERKIEPDNFGRMNIVLAPKTLPKPIDEIEERNAFFSSKWLAHTAKMVQAATEKGITLALAFSFREIEALEEYLEVKPDWLIHKPGKSVIELLEIFAQGQHKLLLTPSAWEGVSIRNNKGKQLFTELLITRLPFLPPNRLQEKVYNDYYQTQKGHNFNGSNVFYVENQNKAVNKMRQGIGRGIRAKDDEITLYLCDPRIPRYGERSGLGRLIPSRFTPEYAQAEIFGVTDKKAKRLILF